LSEDYNKILNVRPGASHAEYRAAYIALAKHWHPDKNSAPGAGAEFSRLAVAYASTLGAADPQSLRPHQESGVARIVRCSRCENKIILPQRSEFVGVMSLLVWSWKWRIAGVFCQSCAQSAALKASAVSLVLGWWSVQGLFLTPAAVFRNLRGGRQDKAFNFKLSCHNLFALTAAGELEDARSLARVISLQRQSIPANVACLVNSLVSEEPARDPGISLKANGDAP